MCVLQQIANLQSYSTYFPDLRQAMPCHRLCIPLLRVEYNQMIQYSNSIEGIKIHFTK